MYRWTLTNIVMTRETRWLSCSSGMYISSNVYLFYQFCTFSERLFFRFQYGKRKDFRSFEHPFVLHIVSKSEYALNDASLKQQDCAREAQRERSSGFVCTEELMGKQRPTVIMQHRSTAQPKMYLRVRRDHLVDDVLKQVVFFKKKKLL